MIEAFIKVLPELSVAVVCICALTFVVYFFVKEHKDEREKRDESFMAYIETNNHQKTKLTEQTLEVIIKNTEALKDFINKNK